MPVCLPALPVTFVCATPLTYSSPSHLLLPRYEMCSSADVSHAGELNHFRQVIVLRGDENKRSPPEGRLRGGRMAVPWAEAMAGAEPRWGTRINHLEPGRAGKGLQL